MKIAQIAPLYEAVPPKLYGGTERVVHYLTEQLVAEGHDVTLFASGDSITKGKLVSNIDTALRLNPALMDPFAHHIVQLQEVIERAYEFDILHFHTDYSHFPFSNFLQLACITTLHGRLDIPDLQPVYKKFPNQQLVSISNDQRKPIPFANWKATIYHGLPKDLFQIGEGKGEYLAFMGRISPEKRVDRAISIAIACNCKLKIAAKVDKADEIYFEKEIKHLLNHPLVEYIGEIDETQKTEFLGNAKALLFPIDWPEPFGLVMIEAMACGTPVIAFKNGSVPEVIDEGITGFLVESIPQAIEAVKKLNSLSRKQIRRVFEKRFSVNRMTSEYLALYKEIIFNTNKSKKFFASPVLLNPSEQKLRII